MKRVEISVLISLIRYEPFFLFSILDFSVKRECLSASRIPKSFVLIIEIYPRLRYRATFALVCYNTILRCSVSYCSFKFSRWYNDVMYAVLVLETNTFTLDHNDTSQYCDLLTY